MGSGVRIYGDSDADIAALDGKTVAVIGFGNQGEAQARNLRDSGVSVVIGSREDESAVAARNAGFDVFSIEDACERADIIFLLVPDEVLPEVYAQQVAPGLSAGNMLVFASGYNVYYEFVNLEPTVDVVLIAPRMIGRGVRDTVVSGEGYPALLAVHQDATGKALGLMLALARAVGATKMGGVSSSMKEETLVDLFSEHTSSVHVLAVMFEALVEAGVSPEVAVLELYGSGELVEVFAAVRDMGLYSQMRLHSHTSQYGQLCVAPRHAEKEVLLGTYRTILRGIESGSFATEWAEERGAHLAKLRKGLAEALQSPVQDAEDALYIALGRRREAVEGWLDGDA